MKKKLLIPLIVLILLLVIVYVSFYSYYGSHFMPNTKINGVDCSGKTAEDAKVRLDKEIEDYVLRIRGEENAEFLTASKLNLSRSYETDISDFIKSQGAAFWFMNMFKDHEWTIQSTVSYSEEALKECVSNLQCMNPDKIVEPVDAYIDEVDGEFVIVADQAGNEVDYDKLLALVKDAVDNLGESVELRDSGIYKKAAITADNQDLKDRLALFNEYKDMEVSIKFGDATEIIDTGMILNWLEEKEGSVTVSEEKVKEYVQSLATKYNSFGTGLPRTFTTQDGKTRSIYGGDYGWWMNQSETAAKILAAINEKSNAVVEPVWRQTAYAFGENDYGNSYCEVDISKQHVWVFIEGEMVLDMDCVTGKVSNNHDTPTGCFGVRFKRTNYTLVGQDYNTKVSYWVPFYDDIGFHDATWRSNFGGSIYLKNGSHGCVNLPYDAAKKLYELTYVGMPVFVYKSES